MKSSIGSKLLGTLKPGKRRYLVHDTKLRGFAIRVYPSGKSAYIINYGRGKIITIADTSILTPAQARQRAVEILADLTRGINPVEKRRQEKRDSLTLEEFLDKDYFPWLLTNRKAGKLTRARLESNFLSLFKDNKLNEISPWIIDKWRSDKLKQGLKKSSINREVTALKAALAKAVEWNLIDKHPLAGLKPFRIDSKPNVRFLDDEEEVGLRKALDAREERIKAERDSANQWRDERGYKLLPNLKELSFADHLKPLVLLALNTGARRGELFNLIWPDIDFKRKILTIRGDGTKAGKTLHIPLNQEALNVLWKWRKQSNGTGLVFPGKNGQRLDNCNTAWRAILKEAMIESFRWHDMRHSFASKLVMSGVDLATVRELLGHADFTMTLRYSHLGDHIKRQAVEKLVNAKESEIKFV